MLLRLEGVARSFGGRDLFRDVGLEVRRELELAVDRKVSRGGFYTTLDRMERKGYLKWVSEVPENSRRKARQRRFTVTPEGLDALKSSRRALITLWDGLEPMLED